MTRPAKATARAILAELERKLVAERDWYVTNGHDRQANGLDAAIEMVRDEILLCEIAKRTVK